jgi:predicted GIY-YIG superfamily endonuclease
MDGGHDMFYTYIIQSLSHTDQRYIGHTEDLRQRLVDHNAGKMPTHLEVRALKDQGLRSFRLD